jgi:rubredoxin
MSGWKLFALLLAVWLVIKFCGTGDFHRHKCAKCGHVWAHFRHNIKDMQGAHTCPQCGAGQPVRYSGAEWPKAGQALHYGAV